MIASARWIFRLLLAGLIVAIAAGPLAAAESTDFQRDVLPLLRTSCIACHNASAAEADLILETPRQILAGGISGPAVLPGNGEASPLYRLAAHLDEPTMPPDDNDRAAPRLSAAQAEVIKRWIDEGAKGDVRPTAALRWQPPAAVVRPIYGLAVSPDGRLVAAGQADELTLFDIDLGVSVARLTDPRLPTAAGLGRAGAAHAGLVQAVAFSPDGSRIATGGFQTVKIWQRQPPRPDWRLAGHEAVCLGVSPDRRLVAFGAADGRIRLADAETGALRGLTLAGHTAAVTGLVFVDGSRLVSAAADGTVRHWRVADGAERGRLDVGGPVTAVAWLGDRLAIAVEQKIALWPLPDTVPTAGGAAAPAAVLGDEQSRVTVLAAVPASQQLVSATAAGRLRLWDVANAKPLAELSVGGPVTALAVTENGSHVLAGTATGRVTLIRRELPAKLVAVATQFAEDDAAAALDQLSFAHDRAKQLTTNARQDLEQAVKLRDAERQALYKAMLEVAKTEIDIGKKDAAAEKPRVAHAAAVAAANAAEQALAAAEGEARKPAEAALKAAQDNLVKAVKPFDTAMAEVAMAQQAHAGAKVTVERITESVARAVTAVEAAQALYDTSKRQEKQAADTHALARRDAEVRGRRLDELEKRIGPAAEMAAPPAAVAAVTAAAATVETAEMAAMRAAMEAMTLVQQTADSKSLAEGMATEAEASLAAARKAVAAADKQVEAARQKLMQAADEPTKKLRAAELMVAEHQAATAAADCAAAEARQQAVARSVAEAVAAVEAAKPEAESLRTAAEAALTAARGALAAATERAADAVPGGVAAAREQLDAWQQERVRAQLAANRQPVVAVGFAGGGQEAVWVDAAGRCGRLAVGSGRSLDITSTGLKHLRTAVAGDGLLLADAAGLSHSPRQRRWQLERQLGAIGDDRIFADRVTAVAFSPDGRLLAVGGGVASRSGQISLWNVTNGVAAGVIPDPHSDAVLCLAFSPDGRLLASGSADRAVRLFELDSQRLVQTFEGHTQHLLGLGWRADGRLLASASGDGAVKVWDVERREIHKSLPAFAAAATSLVYLGAADRFAAACAGGGVQLRDSLGGNAKSFTSDDCLHAVAADRMGRVLATGGEAGVITIWDANGALRGRFDPVASQ
jgi:WD40 repeat protein